MLSGRGQRLRSGLVVGQMALAMMLLAGAGLLLRSFAQLRQVDPGFRTEDALTFRLSLPESAYKEDAARVAFHDALRERLAALPGVRGGGRHHGRPPGRTATSASRSRSRAVRPLPPAQQPSMQVRVVTPDYFDTMGIPLLRGRVLDRRDVHGAPPAMVISESAARRYFPGEDPLGQFITLGMGRGEGKPRVGGEVVGVVGDVKDSGLDQQNRPECYVPYAQVPVPTMDVVLRTSTPPRSLVPAVEKAVHALDPELPVARVATLEEVVARSISEPRFYTILLGAFAGMAVFLAALGHLRRHVLRRRAALARDRHPGGAGRAAGRRPAHGPPALRGPGRRSAWRPGSSGRWRSPAPSVGCSSS